MFQVLEFKIPSGGRVVIEDKLKTQYKGITGMTVWAFDHNALRLVNLELKIDGKEVLPAGFPSELFSQNPYRNVSDCTLPLDFPALSKIEGNIVNGNTEEVTVKLLFSIKL
jgi:hypothetical protein